jgi:SPP1 family predicted phage head-tail adaptor
MISSVLNKKIIIEQGTDSKNAVGTPTLTWAEYITIWAGVYTPFRDVQYDENAGLFTYITEFTIRYNKITKEITNKYRINYDDRYYKIQQISEIGNREGFKLITIAWEDDE